MPGEATAATVGAELQVLLAEAKRLGMQQEHLKQEVNAINAWEAPDAAAKSKKARGVAKLNGCKMTDCPGPVMTVPFGIQCTAGSSDWSESATETPVRNVISGGYTSFTVARDLLRMDLSPANEDSDSGSVVGEIQAPAALPPPAGLTPDQLRRARRHRHKYGLAHPTPNSPKPKKHGSQKNSRFGISISRAREILGMTTTHTAEAQKKSLQKLMSQKSHSFTGGVAPGRFDDMYATTSPAAKQFVARRFDDMYADASPAAQQFVARRFDDVVTGYKSPKAAAQKLAGRPGSIPAAVVTDGEPGSPCIGRGFEKQPHQTLAQKLMSHQAVYSEAEQQVAEHCQVDLRPQTCIRKDAPQQPHASITVQPYSHDQVSAQHDGSATRMSMASGVNTTAINKQVRREYAALVADENEAAAETATKAAACAQTGLKGLDEMEAPDLLALLASLGAQQQAVLSAIAAKQQPSQKAAASRQPAAGAHEPVPSSLTLKGQGVDISVAAGDSAAQAQLHRSHWKI